MALFQTHYRIKQFGDNNFFFYSNSINLIDTDDPKYSDIDVIICDIIDDELEFLHDLMKKHGNTWISFSILCHTCSTKAAKLINNWVKDCFSTLPLFCHISIGLALQSDWDARFKVGTFFASGDIFSANGLNAGSLFVQDYKRIIPHAKEIASIIKNMNLPRLEQIIWIDNWMQQNIQYIKNRETNAGGQIYICDDIIKQAVVTDVLTNHFGTCEDISASIAAILYYLNIPFEVVQGNQHAWLLVKMDTAYYLWDCTHNITRNPKRVHEALKASEYSYLFTLIGQSTYENKYSDFSELGLTTSKCDISKETIKKSIKTLSNYCDVQFSYGNNCPYTSYIK